MKTLEKKETKSAFTVMNCFKIRKKKKYDDDDDGVLR